MKNLILLSVAILTMVGCTKNQDDFAIQNSALKSKFANPYEFTGEQHNAIINSLLQSYEVGELSINATSGNIDFYNSFFAACRPFSIDPELYSIRDLQSIAEYYAQGNLPSLFERVSNQSVTELYREIERTVLNSLDKDQTISELRQIELRISTSTMTENERAALFIMTAVGRHSLELWCNVYRDRIPWRRIALIALCDLCAAAEGFANSWGNPIAAVVEGVCGSISAAIYIPK